MQQSLWDFPQQILEGGRVNLIALESAHAAILSSVLLGPGSFFYQTRNIRTPDDIQRLVERNLEAREKKKRFPFVMSLADNGEVVGLSCFIDADANHRQLEIGGTWIGLKWQRNFVNTSVKLLMLTHAFEQLHCVRVSFKVDAENLKSQTAVLRLGAKFEGLLRGAWVFPGPTAEILDRRNVHVYSILVEEWPAVKKRLQDWAAVS